MPSNFATKWSASYLASLTPQKRTSFLAGLTPQELKSLQYDWGFWARPEQRAPSGQWNTWLILAGRGAGKTRSGAEWVRACSLRGDAAYGRQLLADRARRRDGGGCARRDHRRAERTSRHPSARVPAEIRAIEAPADLAKRRGRDPLQRDGARSIARPAARRGLVRRTRQMALRPRNLGHAAIRAAAWRQSAPGHHHNAAADPAHPRPSRARRARRGLNARQPPTTIAPTSPRISSKPSSSTMKAHASEGRNSMQNSLTTLQALFGRALSWIKTALQAEIRFPQCSASSSASTPPQKPAPKEIELPKPESSLPDWVKMGGDTSLMIYRAVCRPEAGPAKPSQPSTVTKRTPWWSR